MTPLTSQQKTRRAKRRAANPSREMKRVAALCQQILAARAWSIRQLAEAVGVSFSTAWRWHACKGHVPSPAHVHKLEELKK